MNTPIETQATILSDLWLGYRNDEEFQDFCDYNDLGLPLAYAINADIVAMTPTAKKFIQETFSLLLAGLGLEDEGYESLEDVLSDD